MALGIMATDMASHFAKIPELAKHNSERICDVNKDGDRQWLLDTIIHTADLSVKKYNTKKVD